LSLIQTLTQESKLCAKQLGKYTEPGPGDKSNQRPRLLKKSDYSFGFQVDSIENECSKLMTEAAYPFKNPLKKEKQEKENKKERQPKQEKEKKQEREEEEEEEDGYGGYGYET